MLLRFADVTDLSVAFGDEIVAASAAPEWKSKHDAPVGKWPDDSHRTGRRRDSARFILLGLPCRVGERGSPASKSRPRGEPSRNLRPGAEVQFFENVLNVAVDGSDGQHEFGRDVPVGHALRDESGHLQFPCAEG